MLILREKPRLSKPMPNRQLVLAKAGSLDE